MLAIIKTEGGAVRKVDHIPMLIPNTISKIADKAMVTEFQEVYKSESMPRHVGVGMTFAAELLVMGLRMTLHVYDNFVLIHQD